MNNNATMKNSFRLAFPACPMAANIGYHLTSQNRQVKTANRLDVLDGKPLGKSKLLSGNFPSGLPDGRPLGKANSLSWCLQNGVPCSTPLCKSIPRSGYFAKWRTIQYVTLQVITTQKRCPLDIVFGCFKSI